MSIIGCYEDSPYFVSGVEFSGADGNVLRNNAIVLDAIVQQPVSIFSQGLYKEAHTGMTINPVTSEQPNMWRGAFIFRDGLTHAYYIVNGTAVTNERLRIYHKKLEDAEPGTLVYDVVYPSSAIIPIVINSSGYADGDIIEVRIQVYFPGPSYIKTGIYNMVDAFTYPVSALTTTYPGVPTFGSGSTVTEANLNQLSNAQDWIMNRLALVPRIPFMAGMFALGSHRSDVIANPRPMYIGWMNKGNNQNTFHGIIDYYSFNGQEYIRVYINGTLLYTSPLLVNGDVGTLDFTFDVSAYTDGVSYSVLVEQYIPSGQAQQDLDLYGDSIIASRFTIRKLETTDNRTYYTPSDEFDVLESMTYATLKSRLNNFVTGTTNAYNSINNNDNLFKNARMFRQKFGWDNRQISSLDHVNLPTQVRIGERFIVAGKDVKIAWGGYTLTKNLIEQPAERDIYEFANTKSLTGSDKVEVKEGFFDEFEGLYPGVQYYILGQNVSFFAEYLR